LKVFRRPAIHWIRRGIQFAFVALFLWLAWAASYPASNFENLFLRVDPLAGIAAARSGIWLYLLPAWILLGLTLLSGRFFCGWICPLWTVMEIIPSWGKRRRRLVSAIRPKALGGEAIKPGQRRLRWKYLFLIVLLGLLLSGINLLWIFDPLVIANRAFVFVSFASIPFMLIALAVIAIVVGPRFWCQEICPMGACLSLAGMAGSKLPAKASPLALVKEDSSCTHCGKCVQACPFEITEVADSCKNDRLAIADCGLCGECVAACPQSGTLTLQIMGNSVLRSKRIVSKEAVAKGVRACEN
jgi:polyferredoxin